MSDEPLDEVSAAHALEAAIGGLPPEGTPAVDALDRLLVPLGALLLEGSLSGLERTLEVVTARVGDARDAWQLSLGETLAARHRRHRELLDAETPEPARLIASRTALEGVLLAIPALGFEVDSELRAAIEAEDARLESLLDD